MAFSIEGITANEYEILLKGASN